jgi:hypothetical protein
MRQITSFSAHFIVFLNADPRRSRCSTGWGDALEGRHPYGFGQLRCLTASGSRSSLIFIRRIALFGQLGCVRTNPDTWRTAFASICVGILLLAQQAGAVVQ